MRRLIPLLVLLATIVSCRPEFDTTYTSPSKPVSGFYPLAFDWLNEDGTVVERLTDMGEAFATWPPGE